MISCFISFHFHLFFMGLSVLHKYHQIHLNENTCRSKNFEGVFVCFKLQDGVLQGPITCPRTLQHAVCRWEGMELPIL